MTGDLAEDIERAVRALQWVEVHPELPDDRFERCCTAIAASGSGALQPLGALLSDPDPDRRAAAGYVLGRVGEAHESLRPAVREALLTAASVEQHDRVVHALAVGTNLADLDNTEALRLLHSGNVTLRRIATYNLGMVVSSDEDDELIREELAITAASDSDSEVRWWAQFGLDTSRGEQQA